MLSAWMDFHRATILRKLEGLPDDKLRRPMVASGTNLLGLVKHLARAEHYWFVQMFAGEDDGLPRPNSDGDFAAGAGETVDDIVQQYVRVCDRARRIVDAADLDDRGRGSAGNRRASADQFSLRWILIHMIEETARHNGHADIVREQIDGATGT